MNGMEKPIQFLQFFCERYNFLDSLVAFLCFPARRAKAKILIGTILRRKRLILEEQTLFINYCFSINSGGKTKNCCCCVPILLMTFPPEPQRNVSIAAVRGAMPPSKKLKIADGPCNIYRICLNCFRAECLTAFVNNNSQLLICHKY